mmetsp:Transcript_11288/g.20407  ORF Transcript_11288/g.20407 Transcript_11288/m.20407 type:complete len:337 (-) Transcript_11288:855-1865(-)
MGIFKRSKNESAPSSSLASQPAPPEFDSLKLKVQLKSANNRIGLQKNKMQNSLLAQEREIASLLDTKQQALARIKMESNLRDHSQQEALDMLSVFIELLISRLNLLVNYKSQNIQQLPPELLESLSSVVYATPRVDIPELNSVCDQLKLLFGPHVIDEISRGDGPNCQYINHRMRAAFGSSLPEKRVVLEHLKRIAVTYQVDWKAPAEYEYLQNPSVMNIPTQSVSQMLPPGHNTPQYAPVGYQPAVAQQQHQQPGGMYPNVDSSGYGAPMGVDGYAAYAPVVPSNNAWTPAGGVASVPGANDYPSAPPADDNFNAPPPPDDDDDIMERINRLNRR